MVPYFLVYFDVKSLSFAKINPFKILKPLYLQKLVQAKILRCKRFMMGRISDNNPSWKQG